MSKKLKTMEEFHKWIVEFEKKHDEEKSIMEWLSSITPIEEYIEALIADGYTDLDDLVEDGHAYQLGEHRNNGWLYRDEIDHFANVPEERIRDR